MADQQLAFLGNTGLAFVTLFTLSGVALSAWMRRDDVPLGWRVLILAVLVQQAALAYGTLDAYRIGSTVSFRLAVLAVSFLGLILAGLLIAYEQGRAGHWGPTRWRQAAAKRRERRAHWSA